MPFGFLFCTFRNQYYDTRWSYKAACDAALVTTPLLIEREQLCCMCAYHSCVGSQGVDMAWWKGPGGAGLFPPFCRWLLLENIWWSWVGTHSPRRCSVLSFCCEWVMSSYVWYMFFLCNLGIWFSSYACNAVIVYYVCWCCRRKKENKPHNINEMLVLACPATASPQHDATSPTPWLSPTRQTG